MCKGKWKKERASTFKVSKIPRIQLSRVSLKHLAELCSCLVTDTEIADLGGAKRLSGFVQNAPSLLKKRKSTNENHSTMTWFR